MSNSFYMYADILFTCIYYTCFTYIVTGHIVITILPPISTEGMTKSDLSELIDKSRTAMQDAYTKSSEEIKTKYLNAS